MPVNGMMLITTLCPVKFGITESRLVIWLILCHLTMDIWGARWKKTGTIFWKFFTMSYVIILQISAAVIFVLTIQHTRCDRLIVEYLEDNTSHLFKYAFCEHRLSKAADLFALFRSLKIYQYFTSIWLFSPNILQIVVNVHLFFVDSHFRCSTLYFNVAMRCIKSCHVDFYIKQFHKIITTL